MIALVAAIWYRRAGLSLNNSLRMISPFRSVMGRGAPGGTTAPNAGWTAGAPRWQDISARACASTAHTGTR
ncbi:hypothetical protein WL22_20540 [Burkholderia ubonensis]|nr:hypothetical protein WL22_20540 [Burkholderia ubonensis]KWE25210.1 hypothetical protein WL75_08835 [Burkholderia ubonensis]